MKIHIIGGGNLGTALAIGFTKFIENIGITLCRRNVDLITHLDSKNLKTTNQNTETITNSDFVILAIKPHQAEAVIKEILPFINNCVLISAVSGLTLNKLEQFTNNSIPIIRVMPNIAVQYGESSTCISYNQKFKKEGATVESLFNKLGTSIHIEEHMMDGATVLGACGTAFALRYIRAAMQAGIEIGFDSKSALTIAAQTVKGAALMALEEKTHPEQLIDKVTTPQGCTIVGLNEMEHQGFSSSLIKGIKTSFDKINHD